ncbi:MAG: ABC transporter ATP-binding protein [Mariprofundaceae bacterium]|nr:ABC transporter ATP-binding protein [Mariprofundaceae bacterium]
MSRKEIKKKFDDIVAFAEVERFLDTPVKRYSSGMYVRLAFAVAAHLEPEILIVDEVLAVGDAAFQKKCLGKMSDVAKEGRTVLFVSHNMGAVRKLCSRAIMLDQGSLLVDADVEYVVDKYLSFSQDIGYSEINWGDNGEAPSCEQLCLRSIRVLSEGMVLSIYDATKPIDVEVQYSLKEPVRGMRVVLTLLTDQGEIAFASTNHSIVSDRAYLPGKYIITCRIDDNLLNNGSYVVNVQLGQPGVKVLIHGRDYLSFVVEGSGGHGSEFSEKWPGVVAPKLNWKIEKENEPS